MVTGRNITEPFPGTELDMWRYIAHRFTQSERPIEMFTALHSRSRQGFRLQVVREQRRRVQLTMLFPGQFLLHGCLETGCKNHDGGIRARHGRYASSV
jgi:hypothetical protein